MRKARIHSEAIARKPRTVITAIAQCGKPEFDASDWTDPEEEVDEGLGTWVKAADDEEAAADSDESTEADEAAAAAEEREATTESAKVVWTAEKMVWEIWLPSRPLSLRAITQ